MSSDMFNLEGKKAMVTGGASGVGKEIARTLAEAGADVAVVDINRAGAEEVAQEISAMGRRSIAEALDVSNIEQVGDVVQKIRSELGRIDIAVNAAGVADGRETDTTAADIWKTIMDVDLNGVFYCCWEEGKVMIEQKYGKIINIASMSATVVNKFPEEAVPQSRQLGLPAYCAAKAGVKQLTKVLAAFWARHNIRVNCISPGYLRTPLTLELTEAPDVVKALEDATPLGRFGVPEDLRGLVIYLASDSSDFMTGTEVVIDGGYTIW